MCVKGVVSKVSARLNRTKTETRKKTKERRFHK